MISSSKLCRKKICHRARLEENDLLFLWRKLSPSYETHHVIVRADERSVILRNQLKHINSNGVAF